MIEEWAKASMRLWMLSGEMAAVMTLRSMKMWAGGPAASAEMQRMVTEKVAAALALQALAWRGALGTTAPAVIDRSARYYHQRVRANRRRLTRI